MTHWLFCTRQLWYRPIHFFTCFQQWGLHYSWQRSTAHELYFAKKYEQKLEPLSIQSGKKYAHSRTGRSELSHRLNHVGLPVQWSPLLWYKIPSPFSISVWHSSSAHLLPTGKHPCPLCFWKSALLLLNWQKPFGCPGSDWSLLSHWQSISITVPWVEISSQPFRRIRGCKLLINSSCFTPPFIS